MHDTFSAIFSWDGLSWGGVALLMVAHICIGLGIAKQNASRLSALGAALSMIAAAGMGVWSVFALNLVWMGISLWGSRIPERTAPLRGGEAAVVSLGLLSWLCWLGGPQVVAWATSGVYILGWFAFSSGCATRRAYLAACLFAGLSVPFALVSLGAHAFAFNEAFGAVVSAIALWKMRPLTQPQEVAS